MSRDDHEREVRYVLMQRECEIGQTNTRGRSQRSQSDSPLLRLPAELRNRIYELTFRGETVRVRDARITYGSGIGKCKALCLQCVPRKSRLSLLWTCRQVYHEAMELA
jgi:hypothetical protein